MAKKSIDTGWGDHTPTRLRRLAGYMWASPASAVGLVLALPLLVLGASLRSRSGVLEVAFTQPSGRKRRIPFDAITLGHVILGRSMSALDKLRSHELVHVRQYERWGALMFLAYPLSSLVEVLRGGDWYSSNHFETQARERSKHDVA